MRGYRCSKVWFFQIGSCLQVLSTILYFRMRPLFGRSLSICYESNQFIVIELTLRQMNDPWSELFSSLLRIDLDSGVPGNQNKKPTRLLSFTWGHPSEKEGKFLTYQLNPIDFSTVTFQPKKLKRLEKPNWASDKT